MNASADVHNGMFVKGFLFCVKMIGGNGVELFHVGAVTNNEFSAHAWTWSHLFVFVHLLCACECACCA